MKLKKTISLILTGVLVFTAFSYQGIGIQAGETGQSEGLETIYEGDMYSVNNSVSVEKASGSV